MMQHLTFQQFLGYYALSPKNKATPEASNSTKLSSMYINEALNKLRQDDPKLIDILKANYIVPPSQMPYNFSRSDNDIGGQYGQAKYIANTFFM